MRCNPSVRGGSSVVFIILQVELSFQTGNIIYVYGEMDDDGFYMGELDGVRGLVPSNFLTEAPPDFTNGAGPGRGPAGGSRGGGSRPAPSDRGHGPGARGPPPPPREGLPPRIDPRDRRKGMYMFYKSSPITLKARTLLPLCYNCTKCFFFLCLPGSHLVGM